MKKRFGCKQIPHVGVIVRARIIELIGFYFAWKLLLRSWGKGCCGFM